MTGQSLKIVQSIELRPEHGRNDRSIDSNTCASQVQCTWFHVATRITNWIFVSGPRLKETNRRISHGRVKDEIKTKSPCHIYYIQRTLWFFTRPLACLVIPCKLESYTHPGIITIQTLLWSNRHRKETNNWTKERYSDIWKPLWRGTGSYWPATLPNINQLLRYLVSGSASRQRMKQKRRGKCKPTYLQRCNNIAVSTTSSRDSTSQK